MRNILFLILFASAFSIGALAQSGRDIVPAQTTAAQANDGASLEQLFADASGYAKRKFTEYEQKKIRYSESLNLAALSEQKQLAAKYAAIGKTRQNLAGDDFYFLGMLNWMAENVDGAGENLRKFLAAEKAVAADADTQKRQAARAVVAFVAARQKNFDEAEATLADYLKNEPVKLKERALIERELVAAYRAAKDLTRAAPHAEAAYQSAKSLLPENASRARGLNAILDAGFNAFEIYAATAQRTEADRTLEDLRRTAVLVDSIEIYYAAIDAQIKYLIETKRKPDALALFRAGLEQATKNFTRKNQQDDLTARLKKREKQYKLLGEPAQEIVDVDRWFPGAPQTFADLRGKVVLLDFWAMWCAPCIGAFPALTEWQENYKKDGFVIVGLTRYYDRVQTEKVDNAPELARLKEFRIEYNLPYDFAVATTSTSINAYGAIGLPTTVLIDRKGIVRHIETGTSRSREQDIRRQIEKLLAEK